jgi:release factor glutamine methyltransferase
VQDAFFYGLALATLPGFVMTPRVTSEQLVDTALDHLGECPAVVADVGTGSGAIAIAIAKAAPAARVWATDTSPYAVALARANVRRHRLGDRVTVRHGELLQPVPGQLDLIVANLPYLPDAEAGLDPELASEPPEAVFAHGDGLGGYRRLAAASRTRLAPGGALVIQLRQRILTARREGLDELSARLAQPTVERSAAAERQLQAT